MEAGVWVGGEEGRAPGWRWAGPCRSQEEVLISAACVFVPAAKLFSFLLSRTEGAFSSKNFQLKICATLFGHVYGVLNIVKQQN